MQELDVRRVSLTLGVWLGVLYVVCVLGHVVFGGSRTAGIYGVLSAVLLGFDGNRPLSLLLGLLESLAYGALGGGLFAVLYNALPARRPGLPELFPPGHRSS